MTKADEDGRFEFSEQLPEAEGQPSVLWATHPRHLPALAYVELIDGDLRFPSVLEMIPGQAVHARVVDAQGAPVGRAEVEQATPVPTSSLADRFEPQARRILRRTATTDGDGRAELAAWDGPLLLRATCEGLASEVWIGEARPMIQLELRPTFEAGGLVTTEAGSEIEGEQRIVCQVQKGGQLQPLAVVPVSGGSWGPVTLPALAVDGYRFRIEGWNAEIREKVLDPPVAGTTVRVDFMLRAGVDVVTFVQNEEGEPILESTSIVVWEQDGLPVEAKCHPDDDGYSFIRGVPPGVIRVQAEAPGYVPLEYGVCKVPEDPPVAYEITLASGRRLEGRVLSRGQPVEDFEVTFWPYDWSDHIVVPFRERTDGSFVLEAVSTGPVFLNASTQGASPSETMAVDPGEFSPPQVTLEVGDLVRGRGRVVDASAGQPLRTPPSSPSPRCMLDRSLPGDRHSRFRRTGHSTTWPSPRAASWSGSRRPGTRCTGPRPSESLELRSISG